MEAIPLAQHHWELAALRLDGGDYRERGLSQDDGEYALGHLNAALANDPGMADAWLGLHDLGVEPEVAFRNMGINMARFGEERVRTRIGLASRFHVTPSWTCRLDTLDELVLYHVVVGMARRDPIVYVQLDLLLDTTHQPDLSVMVAYLRGKAHSARGEWAEAIPLFQSVVSDEHGGLSARFNLAICLWRAGLRERAEQMLRSLAKLPASLGMAHEANYFLGRVIEDRGDKVTARRHYELAYLVDPGYEDVATRLSAAPLQNRPRPAPHPHESPDATWGGGAPHRTTASLLAELDALTGLQGVKRAVRGLHKRLQMDQRRVTKGLPVATTSKHMIFTGPPGTGKTSVARLIGQLFVQIGMLQKEVFVEASRAKLVGEYLGHTAAKSRAVLESAVGGVLFIDEAYLLQMEGPTGGDAFGAEAIGEILAFMENQRDQILVIAAGYGPEMERFLTGNPGLRSRFATVIEFPSYGPAELVEILVAIVTAHGDCLTNSGRAAALQVFEDVCGARTIDTLGNARFARNLFEKATEGRALRFESRDVETLSVAELSEVGAPDIQHAAHVLLTAARASATPPRRLGF